MPCNSQFRLVSTIKTPSWYKPFQPDNLSTSSLAVYVNPKNSLFTGRWKQSTRARFRKLLLMHFPTKKKKKIVGNYMKLQGQQKITVFVIWLFRVYALGSIQSYSHSHTFHCTSWWSVITVSFSVIIRPVFSSSPSFPYLILLSIHSQKLPKGLSFATEIAALELAWVTKQWGEGREMRRTVVILIVWAWQVWGGCFYFYIGGNL